MLDDNHELGFKGKRLKELRVSNKYTVEKMAELLGVSVRAYRSYEKSERDPSTMSLAILAVIFGVSANYLIGASDDPNLPPLQETTNIDIGELKTNTIKSIVADADVPITSTERNKQRINVLFDKLTTEQQENVIGRAEAFAELNDSATVKNKTHTFPIAAYGGDNEEHRVTEDRVARAIKAANKLDKKKFNGK